MSEANGTVVASVNRVGDASVEATPAKGKPKTKFGRLYALAQAVGIKPSITLSVTTEEGKASVTIKGFPTSFTATACKEAAHEYGLTFQATPSAGVGEADCKVSCKAVEDKAARLCAELIGKE